MALLNFEVNNNISKIVSRNYVANNRIKKKEKKRNYVANF